MRWARREALGDRYHCRSEATRLWQQHGNVQRFVSRAQPPAAVSSWLHHAELYYILLQPELQSQHTQAALDDSPNRAASVRQLYVWAVTLSCCDPAAQGSNAAEPSLTNLAQMLERVPGTELKSVLTA